MDDIVRIDFADVQGKIFSGREKGRKLRESFNLDTIDQSSSRVIVVIPDSVWAVSSSFFLGVFGKSIIICKSAEDFKSKFTFEARQSILEMIDRYVSFVFQNKNLI